MKLMEGKDDKEAYFLSNACSKIMNLIHKITFSVQTCFVVQGHLAFRIIFHLGKYSNTMKTWLML
jgi:hypothetical protein